MSLRHFENTSERWKFLTWSLNLASLIFGNPISSNLGHMSNIVSNPPHITLLQWSTLYKAGDWIFIVAFQVFFYAMRCFNLRGREGLLGQSDMATKDPSSLSL